MCVVLTRERERAGLSQRKLAEKSSVDPSYISKAERMGLRLYPVQAQRIAAALGWSDDPMKLFEEVEEDACSN